MCEFHLQYILQEYFHVFYLASEILSSAESRGVFLTEQEWHSEQDYNWK